VEVLKFGWKSQYQFVESLGAKITVRKHPDGTTYLTDSGNLIFDCNFGSIADPAALALKLGGRAGIVEHGLFIGIASEVIVAGEHGIRELTQPA
jgi:ribose 5-phosphate isomerase A